MRPPAIVSLALVAALVLAAPAAAQGDPKPTRNELRAQARPFGDAALELRRALKPLRKQTFRAAFDGSAAGCIVRAGVEPDVAIDAPPEADVIIGASLFRAIALPFAGPVARFTDRVEALEIDDRIVANGVAGWARLSASLTRLASTPPFSCSRFVAWVRSGFSRAKRPPVPTFSDRDLEGLVRADPAINRAGLRLLQLGVKSRSARGFLWPDVLGVEEGGGPVLGPGETFDRLR
jgi:hypothetical protein